MDRIKFTSGKYNKYRDFWNSYAQTHGGALDFYAGIEDVSTKGDLRSNSVTLGEEDVAGLNLLSKGNDTALFICIAGVVGVLLKKFLNRATLTIHTPQHNAFASSAKNHFVPLFFDVKGHLTIKEYLNNLKNTVQNCYQYQELPQLKNRQGVETVYPSNVIMAFDNIHHQIPDLGQYDLQIKIKKHNDDIVVEFKYRESGTSGAIINSMVAGLSVVIRQFLTTTGTIAQISLLNAAEEQRVLSFGQSSRVLPNGERSLIYLFETAVQRHPNAVAVVDEDCYITYRELNIRANRLAHLLISQYQVKKSHRVAILLDSRVNFLVSLMAVLKAGAAYVPIDPLYPEHRIAYMINDSNAMLCITEKGLSTFSQERTVLILSDIGKETRLYNENNPGVATEADDPAYIIYTSGTSGMPKGVVVANGSVVNTLLGLQQTLDLPERPSFNFTTSFSFDASVKAVFLPFMSGGTVNLGGKMQDIPKVVADIQRHRINVMHATPTFWREMLNDSRAADVLQDMSCISSGGERLPLQLARELKNKTSASVFNLYGPTETSINALYYKLPDAIENEPALGSPLPNFEIFILDEDMKPVPCHAVGEICISGKGLAQGYIHQEDTRRNFGIHPFNKELRLYKTGDLGYWTQDGLVRYLGRRDSQIKFHGYRIDLTEIEQAVRSVDHVKDAVVLVDLPSDADDRLLCFYTGKLNSPRSLRELLTDVLPFYMLPEHCIEVDEIPMLPSGKVDNNALKQQVQLVRSREIKAPANDLQRVLYACFTEVLENDKISVDHDFFTIGGNSIKATKLVYEIQNRLEVGIGLREIFRRPTIEKLAQYIEEAAPENPMEQILPVEPQLRYEASFGQQRQWIVDQNALEHKAYIMSGLLSIQGNLDLALVKYVFDQLVQRHESLRTTFEFDSEKVWQLIHSLEESGFKVEVVHLKNRENPMALMEQQLAEQEEKGFDLETGPLFKVIVFEIGEQDFRLYITLDHIISDGWSMQVLVKEFMALYQAGRTGIEHSLSPLDLQYKDFAHWQNQRLADKSRSGEWKTYWSHQFSGKLPLLDLPLQYPRPKTKKYAGSIARHTASGASFDTIKSFCNAHQITSYVFFLAALNHFLYKLTGQDDLIVGTGASGRTHPSWQGQVGLFANIVPVRTSISNTTFIELLSCVKGNVMDSLQHQEYPFLQLLEDIGAKWSKNRSPLFDVMLMVQENSLDHFQIEGLNIDEVDMPVESSLFDLYFNIIEQSDKFEIFLNYDTSLFNKNGADHLLQLFLTLLTQITSASDNRLLSEYSWEKTFQGDTRYYKILNHKNASVENGEVGTIFMHPESIKANVLSFAENDRVSLDGSQWVNSGMFGRTNLQGELELMEEDADWLYHENCFYRKSDLEHGVSQSKNVLECCILNQKISGVRRPVVHFSSRKYIDSNTLRRSMSERYPKSFVKQFTFNQVPFIAYDEDGAVDVQAILKYPVVPVDFVDGIESAHASFPDIDQVISLQINRSRITGTLHLRDILDRGNNFGSRVSSKSTGNFTHSHHEEQENERVAYSSGGILEVGDNPRSLQEALLQTCVRYPDKGIFIVNDVHEDIFLPYKQLLEEGKRIASGLRNSGMKEQTPVLLQLHDSRYIFSAFWGCILGGYIPAIVAVPPSYQVQGMVLDKLYNAWKLLGTPIILSDRPDEVADMQYAYADDQKVFVANIHQYLLLNESHQIGRADATDIAFYQLTSGSTGVSKCIPETHIGIVEHVLGAKLYNGLDAENVSLNWMPCDHVGAILTYHIKSLYLGCNQVHMKTELILEDPLLWLSYIEKYKVTHTWSPNFGYRLVINALKEAQNCQYDLSSVRYFLNGGEQVTTGVISDFLKLTRPFGLHEYGMQPAFGMAEVCTAFIYNNEFDENKNTLWIANDSLNGHLDIKSEQHTGHSSFIELGPPMPGVEIRIADDENIILPEKRIGRFQIRSNSVMPGYLDNEQANKDAFVGDGWFNSGDLGFIRDGKLTLTGREKEIIIVRGNNFYCFEIEDYVGQVEGVMATYVAACSYKAATADTEGFLIFYVPSNEKDLMDFGLMEKIKSSVASNFRISPDYVIPIEKHLFPKTTSGKIQRISLQRAFENGDFDDVVKAVDIKWQNENATVPNWFFERIWRKKNIKTTTPFEGNMVMIFESQQYPAEHWKQIMPGNQFIFVKAGDQYQKTGGSSYMLRPGEKHDFLKLYDELYAEGVSLTHIIHSWNTGGSGNSLPDLEREQDLGVCSVLFCLQAFASNQEGLHFQIVTSCGQKIYDSDALVTGRGTIPGFIKSVAQEAETVTFQHIDIEHDDDKSILYVTNELQTKPVDQEVAYRKGKRHISGLTHYQPSRDHIQSTEFVRGGMYLIAGGLGNIGSRLTEFLIDRYDATVLIIGTTPVELTDDLAGIKNSDRLKVWQSLRRLSTDIEYEAIDICDIKALNSFVLQMEKKKNKKLAGVVHLAGEVAQLSSHFGDMEKSMHQQLTKDDLLRMYKAKVFGTHSLFALMEERSDALFLTFSSALSHFGGASASAYVSASTFQDNFILHHKSHFSNARSLNWTMWNTADGEMEELKWLKQQRGFEVIPFKRGVSSLITALMSGRPQMFIGLYPDNEVVMSELSDPGGIVKDLKIYFTTRNGEPKETAKNLFANIQNLYHSDGVNISVVARESLPVSNDGDVLRAQLYAQRHLKSETNTFKPETPVQWRLHAIWKNVLGMESIDITSNFFSLGGDSLKATQIMARVKKEFQVNIDLKDIFEEPTILKLSEIIEKAESQANPILPIGKKQFYDVSHAQKRLWIASKTDSEDTSYNVFGAYHLDGNLDVGILEKSLTLFIRKHEILRTNIITVNGEPKQVIHDWGEKELSIDITDLSAGEQQIEEVRKLCKEEAERKFDLENDQLMRVRLLFLGTERHVLLFTMHHIISDAWSLAIVAKEVSMFYERLVRGEYVHPEPLKIQYKDYADWHNKSLNNGESENHKNYWLKRFDGAVPSLEFPTDFARPEKRTLNGASVYGRIDDLLFTEIKSIHQKYEISIFIIMLSLVKALFYRYTGQKDIILKTPVTGRLERELEDQIGFYINTVPLYSRLSENITFDDLLILVKNDTLGSLKHQNYPIDSLVEDLKITRHNNRSPLSDIVILYLNSAEHSYDLSEMADVRISEVESESRINKFDLRIAFCEEPDALNIKVDYNTDLYRESSIQLFVSRIIKFANLIVENPKERIDNIDLSSAEGIALQEDTESLAQAFSGFSFN